MSQTLIEAFPKVTWSTPKITSFSGDHIEDAVLHVSEFYYDTIQGEGVYMGHPAAFLRLQNCTLNCIYCDTTEVWKSGNPYTISELLKLIDGSSLLQRLKEGQHLVLTGGSPLLQQSKLILFLNCFIDIYGFKPFIEIENECIIQPLPEMCALVDCWNNSPKLSNAGITFKRRFNAIAIGIVAVLNNSWFKFVINGEEDWEEIKENFLDPGFIEKRQIILMPEGEKQIDIALNREMVINMAIKHGVRYSTREHIVVWGRKTGI